MDLIKLSTLHGGLVLYCDTDIIIKTYCVIIGIHSSLSMISMEFGVLTQGNLKFGK